MRSILQLFAILLFITPAFFPPGICLCWPLAIALLAMDRSLANQAKALKQQEELTRQVAAKAAPLPEKKHWRDVEQYIDPLCGVYRIHTDDRVFVDARGDLVHHESFDALRVEDDLAIRTVWPDGEDDFVIGVFFEGKMIGVLPAALVPNVRPILADKDAKYTFEAHVQHIDREARDPIVLGYFNFVVPKPPAPPQPPIVGGLIDEITGSFSRVWNKHPEITMTVCALSFAGLCALCAWLAVKHWM